MDFRKYILETQRAMEAPVTGDDFDFQINETLSIECEIVEHSDNTFVIGLDEKAWDLLKEAELVSEAETCMECGMGTMYKLGESKMRCDECGYTMTMEAASIRLHRARESGIDVERNNIGDGYYIGHEVHDDGDSKKVTYSLYHLENPEGLTNILADAFREIGYLNVSPYRANPEEIFAAAAQLKIKDQMNKKIQSSESVTEAEYQGRSVTLGKPSAGDVKKYKVYVRDPKTGNIKKVNFGDKKMSIKRDNPARRKNFRARHNCAQKKDRTTAGYWSCRMWSKKPVSKILKGK
jgi:hypothetical protein